ncbi:Mss4-like protein [Talaromyces proteolyticus]|uniref:Mss4-like protein n=1 Tax=Talaromyces proteolyticus TaxID=1131652 RepID=A0AAD4L2G6_9EURO|nr:Mss4-like protein [Talaromyces proteolyticus]KAH8701999.1 Mss4-like protein [Talaromyces proteolyticus]
MADIKSVSDHLHNSVASDPLQRQKYEPWKSRAPYIFTSDEDFGPVKWQAMCHCSRVQYQIRRESPLAAKYCHCRACQVMHAAPFQWCAIYHKTDVRFTRGVDTLMFYSSHEKSREYQVPTKVYCANCNSPIMDEGRNMCLIFPELIDLGETEEEYLIRRKVFEIDCHIFYSRRIVEVADGKPKWSGIDGRSELLDDNGCKV